MALLSAQTTCCFSRASYRDAIAVRGIDFGRSSATRSCAAGSSRFLAPPFRLGEQRERAGPGAQLVRRQKPRHGKEANGQRPHAPCCACLTSRSAGRCDPRPRESSRIESSVLSSDRRLQLQSRAQARDQRVQLAHRLPPLGRARVACGSEIERPGLLRRRAFLDPALLQRLLRRLLAQLLRLLRTLHRILPGWCGAC